MSSQIRFWCATIRIVLTKNLVSTKALYSSFCSEFIWSVNEVHSRQHRNWVLSTAGCQKVPCTGEYYGCVTCSISYPEPCVCTLRVRSETKGMNEINNKPINDCRFVEQAAVVCLQYGASTYSNKVRDEFYCNCTSFYFRFWLLSLCGLQSWLVSYQGVDWSNKI